MTTDTIFQDSHLPLTKWFLANYMICSSKKDISARQLQRNLATTYKTASYMAHHIRPAMQDDTDFSGKFAGVCEVDETYIGGKQSGPRGRRAASKIRVVGMKERTSGKVPMQAVINVRATILQDFIRQHSEAGSEIHTDKFCSYLWPDSSEFAHNSANHSEKYVDGTVHVNGVENVGSLFKRGIMGVFRKVSGKYLPLSPNEVEFRYNNRDAYNMVDRVLGTSF